MRAEHHSLGIILLEESSSFQTTPVQATKRRCFPRVMFLQLARATVLGLLAFAAAEYTSLDFPVRPCPPGNFFDVSALACLPCPATQEPDEGWDWLPVCK